MATIAQECKLQKPLQKWLFVTLALGASLLIAPIVLAYSNIVQRYTNYVFRVDNGTVFHDLMLRSFPTIRIYIYIFNITNAEEFLKGTDEKIKLEEVGPFVYQEFRRNEDVVINPEPGIMRITPKMDVVFVPEESIAHPNDTYLTLPNLPLLSVTTLLGKYPYLIQKLYSMIVSSTKSKAFKRTSLQDMLWGLDDPLIALANKVAPGLVYYKSLGLMKRLYDVEYDYRLEAGTKNTDKFTLKKSTKMKPKQRRNEEDSDIYVEKTQTFDNSTYEGAVFLPNLTPDSPISIYRSGFCRTLKLQYIGSRPMFYGGDGFVYSLHNSTLNDTQLCDTKGWCPYGLMDTSSCYLGLPLAISKGHFLDADPQLLDEVEGLRPDRKIHDGELIIEPKLSVSVQGSMSLQVSLFLANMAYIEETKRLHDTVLPMIIYKIKSSPPIQEAMDAIHFLYKQGPCLLLATQIISLLCGLCLLAYSARMWYCNWLVISKRNDLRNSLTHRPLLNKL